MQFDVHTCVCTEFITKNINSFELKTGCLFPLDDVSRREIFIVKCGLIE